MMRTMTIALALALAPISFNMAGPAWAQEAPSDALVRSWLARSAGTTSFPIGTVVSQGNPPVSGRVEYVERCSAILILTGIDPPDPMVAQQYHFPFLWAHVRDAGQVPHGVAFVMSSYGGQPVLDIPTDPATLTGLSQIVRECGTLAAMTATYDAFVNLLDQTLERSESSNTDLTLRQDGPCQLTLTSGSRSHAILDDGVIANGDPVHADRSLLRIRSVTDSTETHLDIGPENAHRAAKLIGVLVKQCVFIALSSSQG